MLNLYKVRPILWVVLPQTVHEAEEGGGTVGREGKALSQLNLTDDFVILDPHKRFYTTHQYLPATHTCENQDGERRGREEEREEEEEEGEEEEEREEEEREEDI